jgi:hypothetical protein
MTGIDNELFDRAVAIEARRARRVRLIGFFVASALTTPFGYVLAGMRGLEGLGRELAAVALAVGLVSVGLGAIMAFQWIFAAAFMGFVQPGGRSRGPAAHSKAEALAASGRLDEAAAEFEATRAQGGGNIASLRAEAELHAGSNGDPKRAEELFLRIRKAPDATPSDELYASHRLIDLYMGSLADPGRVMVELRRMADRFPDTVDGQGALAALKQRRDEAQREQRDMR